jgi:hypothetical protein
VHGRGDWDCSCLDWEWFVVREYGKGGKSMVQYLGEKEVVNAKQERNGLLGHVCDHCFLKDGNLQISKYDPIHIAMKIFLITGLEGFDVQ